MTVRIVVMPVLKGLAVSEKKVVCFVEPGVGRSNIGPAIVRAMDQAMEGVEPAGAGKLSYFVEMEVAK